MQRNYLRIAGAVLTASGLAIATPAFAQNAGSGAGGAGMDGNTYGQQDRGGGNWAWVGLLGLLGLAGLKRRDDTRHRRDM
ncbi:MAG TPA: WGxxGxxG family protein [Usitatibacter sp.]|nr:WGxxGxxG family protein [Usitatibacter sp.]